MSVSSTSGVAPLTSLPEKKTPRSDTLVLGAVAYDPATVTIWEGFKAYFWNHDFPFDFILYSNYESMVLAQLHGDIDVAWNSPLAWIQLKLLAPSYGYKAETIAMRDTDQTLTSVIVVGKDSAIKEVSELKGHVVGVGAGDSPQATLLPLYHIFKTAGLLPGADYNIKYHDVLLGKHGDHVGGEKDALIALARGHVSAACLIASNFTKFSAHEAVSAITKSNDAFRVLATTGTFDHCNMSILVPAGPTPHPRAALISRFGAMLLQMKKSDPTVCHLFELECLGEWREGRELGYVDLTASVQQFQFLDTWLKANQPHGNQQQPPAKRAHNEI